MNAAAELDPDSAYSHEQDSDFADEHTRPTFADENADRANTEPDESVPDEQPGGGMPLPEPPD
ncbi:MAG TPA: hypothetical protein VHU91_08520 [Mycobacteriales bacterium]|jgi:hypothetical protein|nr:hypothetical protein [Mycobacteriales bacterium]